MNSDECIKCWCALLYLLLVGTIPIVHHRAIQHERRRALLEPAPSNNTINVGPYR